MTGISVSFSDPEVRRMLRFLRRDGAAALRTIERKIDSYAEAHMASIQDVLGRIEALGSVIQGVDETMTAVVARLRDLAAASAPPEEINRAADELDAYRTRLAAAIVRGTSAESEPAPQVDPAPMGAAGLRASREQGMIGERSAARRGTGAFVQNQNKEAQTMSDTVPGPEQDSATNGQPAPGTTGQWPPREGFVSDPSDPAAQGVTQDDANKANDLRNPENRAGVVLRQQTAGVPQQGQPGQGMPQQPVVNPPEALEQGGAAQGQQAGSSTSGQPVDTEGTRKQAEHAQRTKGGAGGGKGR